MNEGDNIEYFHNLPVNKKEEYLTQLQEINNINKSNIPLKFKILNSKMDMETKSIAISNITKADNMESFQVENI